MVYCRDIAANRPFIKNFGYRYLRPAAVAPGLSPAIPRREVLLELDRSQYYAPQAYGPSAIRKFLNSSENKDTRPLPADPGRIPREKQLEGAERAGAWIPAKGLTNAWLL